MTQLINPLTSYFDGVYSDLSRIKIGKGFMSIFANSGAGSHTRYVENATQINVDLYRGFVPYSKVLSRGPNPGHLNLGSNSKHVKGDYFQNVAYDFPLIRDSTSVSYSELLKYRAFGSVSTDVSMSAIDKAREKLGRNILNIIQGHGSRMEAMAAEALCSGILTLDDGTTYDFDRATGNTITVSTLWSVTATADPIGDFDLAIDVVRQNGKGSANAAIIGKTAFANMIATDQIKNHAGYYGYKFIQMGSGLNALPPLPANLSYMEAAGFVYIAYIKTWKGYDMYLFSYNEQYQDSTGTWTDFMNAKDVLVFDPVAQRDRFFGPRIRFDIISQEEIVLRQALGIDTIQQMAVREAAPTGVLDVGMFHFDAFMGDDRTNVYVEAYTGPLYVPTAVDTTALLDGVVA